ncbi:MAG TPA: ATP-binding cassette domain-containing protein, partial [Deltaproteobacteria bacterium]|nr:ATP-binding cassette domain-containing protein [Deltaproteobacteria bacterium]
MLKIDRISSRYAQVQVLNDVSLEVRDGEVLGLLGRNGAGKSTLLKSVMGLVEVNSGSISMDDVNLSELQAHQIPKNGIGYVPQGRRLFSELTVEENLK